MADKYAHLAPPRPRECHRADGVPKIRFETQARAEAKADEREGYHAYQCAEGHWHVGHVPGTAPADGPEVDVDVARCRVCGCTDDAACDGGCWWVPDPELLGDLCSACLAPEHAGDTRERWLAWRRGGLGGSDIAGVLGLSKWSSPWSVWADKLGLLPAEPESDIQEAGRWLELAIAPWFTARTGLAVAGEQTWLTDQERPWMRCTVDGLVFDSPDPDTHHVDMALGLLEIKTAWPGRRWDEIPADYQCQGQWQMAVTGLPRVWFAVLMGRRLDIHELERDDGDIEFMVERAEEFWRGHVLPGDPPPADDHDATARAIAAVYPTHMAGESAPLDDLQDVLRGWAEAKELKAGATGMEKAAANRIRAALGAAEEGTVAGRRVVTLRSQTRTTRCKACDHTETSDPFRVLRAAAPPKDKTR